MHETLKEATEKYRSRPKKRSGWRCTRYCKKEEWMEMHETLKEATENIWVEQRRGVDGVARDIERSR